MKTLIGRMAQALLATFILNAVPVARADMLGDILSVLHTTGVIDQAVVEAKPMIQCLIDGSSVEQCAKVAGTEAKGLVPKDPKIQKVVDVFYAVKAKDWLKVFVLAGEQVVCSLVPGGAVKDLFCGPIFAAAEPVITSAYGAVRDGDILELVSLVGVEYACDLLPNAPGASELCGVLGDIAAGVAKGIGTAIGALGNLAEDISGQIPHMPVEQYYLTQWRNWLHYAVVKQLRHGKPAYLYAGMYGGTSCVEYFDSHKMSASNAEKVCDIMKKRFLQEVADSAKVFEQFPAAYFAGAVAPRVPGWASQYYDRISTTSAGSSPPADPPGHWITTYWPKAVEPMKQVLTHCLKQTPLELPKMPGEVHQADQANLGIAQGWACVRVLRLLDEALSKQKAVVNGLAGKLTALGCTKTTPPPALHFSCPTYAAHRQCRALYPHGMSAAESLCWVNAYAADPALAKQIAAELGPKRCTTVPNAGTMGMLSVQCTRPWKQAKCKSLVATYSEGVLYPPGVGCLLAGDRMFIAGRQKAKSIVTAADPGPHTLKRCRTAPESEWDPLRISCQIETARKQVAAQVPTCLADPGYDGADAVCLEGSLSAKTAPAAVAQQIAPNVPVDVRLIDVQFAYFERKVRSWSAIDAPKRGAMVAMRCTYAYAPENPTMPEWSIAFLEGDRVLDRAAGAGPLERSTGRISRTWYGTLIEPGAVQLGCLADDENLLKEGNESDNRMLKHIQIPGAQRGAARSGSAPRADAALRVARATALQASQVRGRPPALDLAFPSWSGIKRAQTSDELRSAPAITSALAGEPLLIDCSYVVFMDAMNGEPIAIPPWTARIEVNGQTVKQATGATNLVSVRGARAPAVLHYRWSAPEAGDYEVRCHLDTSSAIGETDETNNTRAFTVKVPAGRRSS